MNWTGDGEHKPVPVGNDLYCAKCGTKLSGDPEPEIGPDE